MNIIFSVDRMLAIDPILRLSYLDSSNQLQQMKEFSLKVIHHPYLELESWPRDSRPTVPLTVLLTKYVDLTFICVIIRLTSLFFRFNVKHESIDILAYNNDKRIEVSSIIDQDNDKVKFIFHPPELGVFHIVDVLICGRSISEISRLTPQNFFDPTHIIQKVLCLLLVNHFFLTL